MESNICCPVCQSQSATTLRSVSSEAAAQQFILREKDESRHRELRLQIEKLWGRETCSFVRCSNCDFVYAHPYVSGDRLFYELAYDQNRFPEWKWEFQVALETLKNRVRIGHRLLEIGPGEGAFVRRLDEVGVTRENIVCIEYSAHGRKRIEDLGIRCFSEDVRTLSVDRLSGPFDTICLFQVLEHLDQLDRLFKTLRDLLLPGGSILIAVPNPAIIDFEESNDALLDMPPNHIGRWNQRCFARVAEIFGFELRAHATEPFNFVSAWKQFSYYRFLRAAQRSGSIANQIHSVRKRRLRQGLEIGYTALEGVRSLPTALKMTPNMGFSQWAHLVKNDS